MPYFLHITRPPHFASRIRRRISAGEWESLRFDAVFTPVPDCLHAHTFIPAPGRPPAILLFKDGNILCKNPDEPTVDKLLALADALGAILQGEDGEIYTSSSQPPHLTQFALFERPSRRLRIRFPQDTPQRGHDAAAMILRPIYMQADSATAPVPADVDLRQRTRMPVGFPSPSRQPSAALRALLNPLRPVQV